MTAEARRHGSELRRLWSRYAEAEMAVWNALVGDDDDLLRSFYLAVRADITDATSSPAERAETLTALLRVAENEDGGRIDSGNFDECILCMLPCRDGRWRLNLLVILTNCETIRNVIFYKRLIKITHGFDSLISARSCMSSDGISN